MPSREGYHSPSQHRRSDTDLGTICDEDVDEEDDIDYVLAFSALPRDALLLAALRKKSSAPSSSHVSLTSSANGICSSDQPPQQGKVSSSLKVSNQRNQGFRRLDQTGHDLGDVQGRKERKLCHLIWKSVAVGLSLTFIAAFLSLRMAAWVASQDGPSNAGTWGRFFRASFEVTDLSGSALPGAAAREAVAEAALVADEQPQPIAQPQQLVHQPQSASRPHRYPARPPTHRVGARRRSQR